MSAAHVPHHPHFSGLRGDHWQLLLLTLTTAVIALALSILALVVMTAGDIAKEEPAPVTVNEGPEMSTP